MLRPTGRPPYNPPTARPPYNPPTARPPYRPPTPRPYTARPPYVQTKTTTKKPKPGQHFAS